MKHSIALLVALLLAVPTLVAAEPLKPNSILADDWGWGDLSCHGHLWLKTWNLDKFAREGTDFQQFNVLNPVCPPSRNDVMTGHYPAWYCVHQHFAAPAQNHARNMPDWPPCCCLHWPRSVPKSRKPMPTSGPGGIESGGHQVVGFVARRQLHPRSAVGE